MLIISNSARPPYSCDRDNESHLPWLHVSRAIRQPETNYADIKIITRAFFRDSHPVYLGQRHGDWIAQRSADVRSRAKKTMFNFTAKIRNGTKIFFSDAER